MFRTIGPGAIMLGASIGGGEWLMGPTVTVKYGLSLLSIAVVAIFLQTQLNLELVRYTLYSGEPIFTGFMRTRPGPRFWGTIYACFTWLVDRLRGRFHIGDTAGGVGVFPVDGLRGLGIGVDVTA